MQLSLSKHLQDLALLDVKKSVAMILKKVGSFLFRAVNKNMATYTPGGVGGCPKMWAYKSIIRKAMKAESETVEMQNGVAGI